ncbi:SusD-like starch-binding protein associating with outer membrane [Leeuwenhoekiella aestuarii]|uniref:SusD-like starch-binding protein associating with outer membrane n=1 Tax=Leeuwenhoekiella aestuarii TaxID=2249426 RepID=A0A4Q0NZS5_9FLAO|nr:SusD/RagB family nutrient-binding outer membrane lipoprotein [Leeuwenhoekiella aestuarii]RXG18377.1 SusD-like starch-binding protein associating with outer membrane [Leeuwenhoekiella aestuarii]RXG19682.1 SusD-like starch-binding protein associating with outer membrane [Leeuwenhoekiella aestuarii]
MKNLYIKYISLIMVLCIVSSCDEGFDEVNTNPDASTSIEAEYMFTKAMYDALNNSTGTVYEFSAGGFVQHFATYLEVPGLGDKYVYTSGAYPYAYFNGAYVDGVNEISKVLNAVEDDPDEVNKYAIALIWQAYIFHRITDLYGMIPYSEATTAYASSNFAPVYDTQQTIYLSMLSNLESAISSFDASKESFNEGDLLYAGDTSKWEKFANSLMLRLAMRLTKVDPTTAQQWAQKAIAGGVIEDETDDAIIDYVGGQVINSNPISFQLRNNNYSASNQGTSNTEGGKYSDTFIGYLKDSDDPRLNSIAAVWVDGVQVTDTDLQQGMPNGLNNRPDNFASLSEPNLSTILSLSSSLMVIGSSEMNLLLAEASIRGWESGDAKSYYDKAIHSSMNTMGRLYGTEASISEEAIEQYIATKPFPTGFDAQMEHIHTQFWVSVFPDEIEVYSNWRRTNYPVLTPVNVTGNLTGGTIPRRLTYPPGEISVNSENYNQAISAQGVDNFTTRIWWDVAE